jgi:hypothetical protein
VLLFLYPTVDIDILNKEAIMHKYVKTILEWDRDKLPPLLFGPVMLFAGGTILIVVTMFVVHTTASLRPGIFWVPTRQSMIPTMLGLLVILYPLTIILSIVFNPSIHACKSFKRHWFGMEKAIHANWFRKYACSNRAYEVDKINAMWEYMKGYYTEGLDIRVLANNVRNFKILCRVLYYASVIAIPCGFVYVGYIAGLQMSRNYSATDIMETILLMKKLTVYPIVGLAVHWLFALFYDEYKWKSPKEFNAKENEVAMSYYNNNLALFTKLGLKPKE